VSILDLEMTDKMLFQFVDMIQLLSQRQTGNLKIVKPARRAVLHDGVLRWQSAKSAHYYYSAIPGR
jgi:hypothetical protein